MIPSAPDRRCRLRLKTGFNRQSLKAAKRWNKLDPDETTPRLLTAQMYLLLDEPSKARKAFARLVKEQEEARGPLFLNLAALFLDSDVPWSASEIMEDLVDPYPDLAEAHYANAAVAMAASRYELAREASIEAIEKDPEWLAAKTIAARAQIQNGDIDGGLNSAEEVVIESRDLDARLEFAFMLMSVGPA